MEVKEKEKEKEEIPDFYKAPLKYNDFKENAKKEWNLRRKRKN